MPAVPFGDKTHHRSTFSQRVYYEDTDAQGIVYHVTYLRWCEQALEVLLAGADAWRIERADLRYLEAARFADRLEVRVGARPDRRPDHAVVDLRIVRLPAETVLFDATLDLTLPDGVPTALLQVGAGVAPGGPGVG